MWQAGQILVVLSAPHLGQSAARSRPSLAKTGGSTFPNPVRSRRTGSISGEHRSPLGPIRPEHLNQISRSENPV
jgi:hypothetical protein